MGGREVFGLRFFRSKTSDAGNFSRVQNEVKLIFENISVFLGGFFTPEKGRTRRARRKKTGWELECGNGGGLAAQLGRFGKTTLPVLT